MNQTRVKWMIMISLLILALGVNIWAMPKYKSDSLYGYISNYLTRSNKKDVTFKEWLDLLASGKADKNINYNITDYKINKKEWEDLIKPIR